MCLRLVQAVTIIKTDAGNRLICLIQFAFIYDLTIISPSISLYRNVVNVVELMFAELN